MVEIVEADAASAPAQRLLGEYLDLRARTFPVPGAYRRNPADPRQFVRPDGAFVMALVDGREIGCGGVRLLDGDRAEIKHLFVRADAQGGGVGRSILERLHDIAAELGAQRVVLDTHSSLARAAALYRSLGYAPIPAYNDNPNADRWLAAPLDPRS